MTVQTWVDTLAQSLQTIWQQLLGFLPNLVGAILILIIGAIVATGLEKLVERIVYFLKLDTLLRQLGVEAYLDRANVNLNSGHFLGKIVYWFFVLVFFSAAAKVLGMVPVSDFLSSVLGYIPNVIGAALILLIALAIAHFLRGLVRTSVMGVRLHAGKTLGAIAWWGVVIFGFLAALTQLGVAVQIINTLITGLVAMLALAGGLAFGLGGKEHASDWLTKMRDELSHRG
ncbi:MAG: hypothetical protein AAB518_00185 [Patescibacteria group bacterium]